jgi:uncharacterized membrane protein YedE/YeeE
MSPATTVLAIGLLLAIAFGAVASKSGFCIMGAISDARNMGDWGRMRMWLLALAVAMVSVNLMYLAGWVDLADSVYQRPVVPWLSLLLGGALFGAGMTLAGGCPNKNLIRLGAGSIRSLVVLVFVAISAYMTLKGLFAHWRTSYLDPFTMDLAAMGLTNQGLASVLAKATGMPHAQALLASLTVVGAGLLYVVLKDRQFRNQPRVAASATVLGLLVAAGWYLTGSVGHGENPDTLEIVYFATNTRTLESFSFVAPTAYSLELLMLWSDRSLHATFGIVSVMGVTLGSLAMALATGSFRLEGFASVQDLGAHLTGAVLMGFGGVTAYGCTVGQGLSGLSTLAPGSLIAVAGIVCGSIATMRWLERG